MIISRRYDTTHMGELSNSYTIHNLVESAIEKGKDLWDKLTTRELTTIEALDDKYLQYRSYVKNNNNKAGFFPNLESAEKNGKLYAIMSKVNHLVQKSEVEHSLSPAWARMEPYERANVVYDGSPEVKG